MKSFIKSHSRSASLETPPPRLSRECSDISQPVTPPPGLQVASTKHSPKLESLQKFTTLFNSKIFKKHSASASQLVSIPSDSSKVPSDLPQHGLQRTKSPKRRSLDRFYALPEGDSPVIKGTVKHSWGGHDSPDDTRVIVLNSLNDPMKNNTNEFIRSVVPNPKVTQDAVTETKARNRQARLRTQDDFYDLESKSEIDLEMLNALAHDSNDDSASPVKKFINKMPEGQVTKNTAEEEIPVSRLSQTNDRDQNHTHKTKPKRYIMASKDDDLTIAENDHSDNNNYEDGEGDMSDSISNFSFELSGITGRTSSMKYYTEPGKETKQTKQVFINDLYGNEELEDDMNFYDSDDNGEEVPHFYKNDFSIVRSTDSLETPAQPQRKINNYNDLMDLSDRSSSTDSTTSDTVSILSTPFALVDDVPMEMNSTPRQSSPLINSPDLGTPRKMEVDYQVPEKKKASHTKALNSYADIYQVISDNSDAEEELVCDEEFNNQHSSTLGIEDTSITKTDIHDKLMETERVRFCSRQDIKATPAPIYANHALSTNPAIPGSSTLPKLPPPARSQTLKYHDLSVNLDSELPQYMSNLYFIGEEEEDEFNMNSTNKSMTQDEEYLDEINTIPEDFEFSDSEQPNVLSSKSSLNRGSLRRSFKGTHSFVAKPRAVPVEPTPLNNKLALHNRTVTFFNSNNTVELTTENVSVPQLDGSPTTPINEVRDTRNLFLSPIEEKIQQ